MTGADNQPYVKRERRFEFYREPCDWWIGYYRGAHHHYVCLLPTLVIRWPRDRR